jgi:pentatricopeptide repeat protein
MQSLLTKTVKTMSGFVCMQMRAARHAPDAVLWNALIAAAGRAGQLQRAFHTLEEMQARPYPPGSCAGHAAAVAGLCPAPSSLSVA